MGWVEKRWSGVLKVEKRWSEGMGGCAPQTHSSGDCLRLALEAEPLKRSVPLRCFPERHVGFV